MLLNKKIFDICIMHEFAPQKTKICKRARKKYHYLESLREAICEISNFYNFPPRMLIFGTHMPPAVTMHASNYHSSLSDTLSVMIFCFWK